MAYGVLQELRDTLVVTDGRQERLLDKVTHISSVSGGSFTAAYFIRVSFEETLQPQLKLFLNKIPTSFNLTDEEVDTLIASARSLLRTDLQFQQLLADLAKL